MKTMEQRNKRGQVEEFAYSDAEGKPMLNDWGVAKKRLAYDANGNVIEERFYGLAGEPVLSKVCRCTRIARSFRESDAGRVVEERYYGLCGEPVTDTYNTAGRVWLYDIHDCPIEDRCFGLAEEPVVHKMYGCAKTKRTFDANNRFMEERYYGVSEEPVTQKVHGFMKITCVYQGEKAEKLYHKTLRSKGVPVDREALKKLSQKCQLHGIEPDVEV